jgi:hypothetical protein
VTPSDLAFYAMAVNPIGGLLVAIPFAILKLHYSLARTLAIGIPLAYVQVVVVDLTWSLVSAWPAFERFMARRRSPRVERLLAARGGFWVTFVATPFIGPWLVMAFMRYAQVSHRRVALPIAAALTLGAALLAVACVVVPNWFATAAR